MEENSTKETVVNSLPDDDKLFSIAYWSKTISWVVLVVGAVQFLVSIYSNYSLVYITMPDEPNWITNLILSSVSNGFSMLTSFFVLQAVGEVLYLVIDIKEQLLSKEQ